jgi:hypothetical protein
MIKACVFAYAGDTAHAFVDEIPAIVLKTAAEAFDCERRINYNRRKRRKEVSGRRPYVHFFIRQQQSRAYQGALQNDDAEVFKRATQNHHGVL